MKEFIEKLIERLKELQKISKEQETYGRYTAYSNAIRIVNQLAEEHKGGWIYCSERLPENNKVVLCWVKSTTIASGETYIIGSCDRGFWFLQTYEIGHHHFPVKDYEVVAWQQLPEPLKPKEEQHDMSGWKGAFMNTFLSRN